MTAAITFALPAESADFIHLLSQSVHHEVDGLESIHGQLHGRSVVVPHTGVGKNYCRRRIEPFLRQQHFDCLISAGFAGALREVLKVGDIFLAENFVDPEILRSPHIDSLKNEFIFGNLVTVSEIVDSRGARDRLAAETGSVAVDMETSVIADACRAHSVAMLSLRVITDTPLEPLPAPPNILFNLERQKTEFGRLAFYLLSNPRRFKQLLEFRRRVALARKTLASGLEKLLSVI